MKLHDVIVKRVAQELDMHEHKVHGVVESFLFALRDIMENPKSVKINITNFGELYLKKGAITRSLEKAIESEGNYWESKIKRLSSYLDLWQKE